MVMDRDDYEDYLVDKAKELLHESSDSQDSNGITGTEDMPDRVQDSNRQRRRSAHGSVDEVDSIEERQSAPDRNEKEAEFLSRRREHMGNDELEEFLAGTSEFHDQLDKAETPSFSDWETRILITNSGRSPEELAEELDRNVDTVKLQMKLLGLDSDGSTDGYI